MKKIGKIEMKVDIGKSKTMIINSYLTQARQTVSKSNCRNKYMEIVTTYEYLGTMRINAGRIVQQTKQCNEIYYSPNKLICGKREN